MRVEVPLAEVGRAVVERLEVALGAREQRADELAVLRRVVRLYLFAFV